MAPRSCASSEARVHFVAIALFTAVAAAVGIAQWYVLSGQLAELRDEQRPWIGLSGVNPGGDNRFYFVVLKNGGKSPALNADIAITGGVGTCEKYRIPRERCAASRCTFHQLQMIPDVPFGARVPRTTEPQAEPNGEVCIIVRADYEDQARITHKTGICLVWSGGGSRSCDESDSNYAD